MNILKKKSVQNNLVIDLRRIEKKPNQKGKLQIFLHKLLAKKTFSWLFLVVLIFVFILSLGFFIRQGFSQKVINETSKNQGNDELNSTIYQSPQKINPGGLNLIFFANQYVSGDDFDNDVNKLMDGLRTIDPWKNYNQFNIYKINPGNNVSICQIKTENERKPVLRCNNEINVYLSKLNLERFKLIVLSRQDFQSWANVFRIENAGIFFSVKDKITESSQFGYTVLFAHLMGHAFGLKDEEKFVIAKANGEPHTPDGPNCAPDMETAQKWWGDLAKTNSQVGFFKTCCGNENYIKPTQSSLMNLGSNMENFVPNYGPVSEIYLDKILKYCFSNQKISQDTDPAFFQYYPELKICLF